MRRDIPIQAIERRLQEGMTYAEIGQQLGLTVDSVRGRVERSGGPTFRQYDQSLPKRLRIEASKLSADDAVEMLLWVIESVFAEADNQVPELSGLTPKEHSVFSALWLRSGAVVTKETLLGCMYLDRSAEEIPEIKIVDVFICKLRRKLPPQYQIETIWGRGYRMTEVEKGNE